MADKTRAVLVGCGGITRTWMRAVLEMDDVEMVGFVDLVEQAARARAEEYGFGGAAIGTDLAAILARTQPDVVFNCTVPEAHYGVTLAALEHGCHVLTEKPLADSMAQAREMVAAADRAGRILAVIQNRRYDARIRRLAHLVASGRLGPLTTLNCDFYIGAHFGGFRDRMEHVLLLDMAIHTFDQARLISGTDPVSVYCREWNPQGSWYDHDASAVAVFEMTNGVVYTYRGSWCSEGLNTTWECDWRAIGVQGSAFWDGADTYRAEAVREAGGFRSTLEEVEVPAVEAGGKVGGHAGCIAEFIHCVRHGGAPETAAADNIKSLAMVFGAIESARTGRTEQVVW
jgi:predicted dehydrogenase